MGKAGREPGKRLLARFLRQFADEVHRTSQYGGRTGDASDVVGLAGLHIKCKFVERLNIPEALRQAIRNGKTGVIPVAFHKGSREKVDTTGGSDGKWIPSNVPVVCIGNP